MTSAEELSVMSVAWIRTDVQFLIVNRSMSAQHLIVVKSKVEWTRDARMSDDNWSVASTHNGWKIVEWISSVTMKIDDPAKGEWRNVAMWSTIDEMKIETTSEESPNAEEKSVEKIDVKWSVG
jgi:hypothetical protein